MERIIEKILQKKFGKFFYGIDHKHIHVGLLAGRFTIEGIGLQPNVFNSLNLPIVLKYSFVEKMHVSYAWRESVSNLVINIENIYAIVTPKQENEYNFVETLQRNKEDLIREAIKDFQSREKEAQKKSKERSTFENLFIRMLDNINLVIKHIHIRYEHHLERFSFGVTIHEILVETRDAYGNKCYFQREKSKEPYVNQVLEVNSLGVYWNNNESNLLAGMAPADITSRMYELSMEDMRSGDDGLELGGRGRSSQPRMRYIININMFCSLKKYLVTDDFRNPEYECEVNFQEIEAKVTHDQYRQIMKLVQAFLAYQAQWKTVQQANELQNYKLKSAREILNMMRAKKYAHQGDESQYTTKYVRSYLTWVFRSIRERYIMKKFVSIVIQRPITFENIKAVPELKRIIHKMDESKIKQWLQLAMRFKADYEREAPRVKIDKKEYLNIKLEATLHQAQRGLFRNTGQQELGLSEQQTTVMQSTDETQYIWFKLRISIQSGRCEISKGEFGLLSGWNGLHAELLLRKGNFYVDISMSDFSVKLFDSWGAGGRAYVDVLKKTPALDYNTQKKRLLTLQFEKNPIAKPYVFTESRLQLRSIELTAFPSSLKKLYEILSEGVKKESSEQAPSPKPQNLKTQRELDGDVKTAGFMRNSISAKVHSPWIIIPFSKVNDKKSECWVVRLGDFSVNTPMDSDVFFSRGKDEELYYEHYEMALQNFELKYYSSIHYFYSCLKFGANRKLAHLLDSELMEHGSVLDVVKPFSSSLTLQFLKKMLSSNIKDSNFAVRCTLVVDAIEVSLSSVILAKLKGLWEEFKKDESPQFLQHAKQDILQGASLKGMLSVRYGKFSNMRFYGVLAGHQLYLFASEHSRNHQLQLNLQAIQVRLIDTEHLASCTTFNKNSTEVLELFFEVGAEMTKWAQHIGKSLTGKELVRSVRRLPEVEPDLKLNTGTEFRSRQSIIEPPMKKESKYRIKLVVSQLALSLYDEKKEFLSCRISQLTFNMVQFIRKGFDLIIHQFELYEPSPSVQALVSSKHLGTGHVSPKFINLKIMCDDAGAIREVEMHLQDILIVWKIEVIQRVIAFFFLESQNPTTPTPPQPRKRIIEIAANMQRFHLVFAHKQYLTGVLKFTDSRMVYKTTSNSETYDFNAARLEVFNYENSDPTREVPLFRARSTVERQRFEVFYSAGRAVEHSESPLKRRLQSEIAESSYITASELVMTIAGYQIHYMHEQFMRMFNYVLNKVMGSLSTRFRQKREHTPEYIYEAMKVKRNGSMRIEMLDCVLRMLDTADSQEHLRFQLPRVLIHKNVDSRFAATVRATETKLGPMMLPYEKLIIEAAQMDLYYIHEGRHERLKVNNLHPLSVVLQYNKWNLQRDYFPVLRNIDDIDRTITVHIDFEEALDLNFQKIVFYMIMKIYYRNMKHKDGLAEEYEPAALYPTPREYKLRIPEIVLHLSEEYEGLFRQFALLRLPNFRMDAREVRTLINFNIRAEQVFCRYDDGLAADTIAEVYRKQEQSVFKLDMQSDRGVINADIMLRNYKLSLDINQIDSFTDYFDFDATHVENKRMPKKSTKSFQNFRITFKDGIAVATSGEDTIGLAGLVFINLSKNPGSEWDEELIKFLGEGVGREDVNEKELKVNAENVSVYMNSTKVTELPNLLYTRNEFSARKSILLQSMQLCFFLSYVKVLQRMYKQRIKKVKVKKSYFDPAAGIPPKIKYDDKRIYSIEGDPLSVMLMHPHAGGCFPIAKLVVSIRKLIIGMRTSVVKHIGSMFDLRVFNRGPNFQFLQILQGRSVNVQYDSDDGRKQVRVGENILELDTFNINEAIVNQLAKAKDDLAKLPETATVKLINDTDSQVGIELGFAEKALLHEKLHRYETRVVPLSHYHYCRLYAEKAYVRIGLLQFNLEAKVELSSVDCRKLFSLEGRYYLSVAQDELLTVRIMSQFKLENKTKLRFRYRLRSKENTSKTMLTMEPNSSHNVNFCAGSELVLFDEASQEETVLGFHNKFEHRSNYNYRLRVGRDCMSTLMLTPKVLLTNMLPLRLGLSHSKLQLSAEPFETVELHEHSFRAKKEVSLEVGDYSFKCSTNVFLERTQGKPSLLELTDPQGHVSYTLELEVTEKDDSLRWVLKPQVVLSNLTGGVLELVRGQQLVGLAQNCSVIGNREEPFVIRGAQQFKLNVGSLKHKQEVQSQGLVMVLINLNHEGIKVPTVLVYSEVTVLNETKHVVTLDDGYRTLQANSSCSVHLRQRETLTVGIGLAAKELSLEGHDELYFYLAMPPPSKPNRNQPARLLLKAEIVRLQKRKIIRIAEEASPSHYWFKNNMKGFTLTVRQLGNNSHQHFIVPESSQRGVSLEQPSLPDTFEVEFYYNLKNIDFGQKLVLVPNEQPKFAVMTLDEQGVFFTLKFTFEKGKNSLTLTLDLVESSSVEQPTVFDLEVRRVLFNVRFSAQDSEQMCLLLELLRGNMTKLGNRTSYDLTVGNLAAQYRKNHVLCKHKRERPFAEISLTLDKALAFTNLLNAQLLISSFDVNIHEEFLHNTASFLKRFELLEFKKSGNSEKNIQVVRLLRSGDRKHLQRMHELELAEGRKLRAKDDPRFFVTLLQLQPVTIVLSYLKGDSFNVSEFRNHSLLSTCDFYLEYLTIIPNIKELRVPIGSLTLKDVDGTQKSFKKKLISHIKKSIPSSVSSSISSLSVLENPVEALDTITGIVNGIWSIS